MNDLKDLHEGFFLWTQALATSPSLICFPQYDPSIHKSVFRSLIFGHARENFQAIHVLAPFSLTHASFNTTSTLIALHLKSNGYISLFLEDYNLNQDLEFSSNSFSWHFNACHIYWWIIIFKWFFNTFGIIFI
jgi:hypothetical protein